VRNAGMVVTAASDEPRMHRRGPFGSSGPRTLQNVNEYNLKNHVARLERALTVAIRLSRSGRQVRMHVVAPRAHCLVRRRAREHVVI
jgi:hypothetical protein